MNLFEHLDRHILGRLPPVEAGQVYAVGGCVRDLLLGRHPQDYDLAVFVSPARFADRIATDLRGRWVMLGHGDQQIYRVVTEDSIVDIAKVSGATIETDLKRRDYTVNAMACDLATGQLIDPTGGLADLKSGTVCMVSVDGLRRDPLRMIRAYRLAAQFAWKLDPATARAIQSERKRVRNVAGERVWSEIQKILATHPSLAVMDQMIAGGLLIEVLPELTPLLRSETGRRNGMHHLLSAYGILERLLENPAELAPGSLSSPKQLLADIPAHLLKLSLLLHEAGRPQPSMAGTADGGDRWPAALAYQVCRRLRTSVRQADYVAFILQHHLRPLRLYAGRPNRRESMREQVRFFLDCHPRVTDVLLHAAADQLAEFNAENANKAGAFKTFVQALLDTYYREMRPRIEAPPLLTGSDLKQSFHLKPSPQFRIILKRLQEARLMGEIRNRADALDWVRAWVDGQKPL
ncbi:MAG TPA: CCA tRNA nucleotidyltransferase [Desulfobacterales bacterium]